jgi:hypothetical protein
MGGGLPAGGEFTTNHFPSGAASKLICSDVGDMPENWLFYVGDAIILQVVSHEQEATIRLSETQYAEFKTLGIAHQQGQPQWSGLPEVPMRETSSR